VRKNLRAIVAAGALVLALQAVSSVRSAVSPCKPPVQAVAATAAVETESSTPEPEYVRIKVSKRNVYVEFRGTEVRVAATAVDLETAKPVPARKPDTGRRTPEWISRSFPAVDLPVSGDQLPAGFVNAKAGFTYDRFRGGEDNELEQSSVDVKLGLSRTDKKGVRWTYWVTESAEPGKAPVSAPVINLPKLIKPTLKVTTESEGKRKVGVAIVAKSGELELSDITREGKSVQAHLRVLDRRNKAVVSEKGPLSKYGFG